MTAADRRTLFRGLAFVSPWLVGLLAFTVIPVLLSLYYSFCDYALTAPDRPAVWVGLGNYKELLHDPLFWTSLSNTMRYAAMALPAGLIVSLGLALMLNANMYGQAAYRAIIFLPSLVPAVATAMVWLWLFNGRLGLLNFLLNKLGLPGADWLGTLAMPSLAFMSVWGVGNTVVIYLAGLQDVPRELLEAAEIDGAGPLRRLFAVTLPTLSPVIFFNLIMAIIGTFSTLTVPYIMTGGGPNNSTYFYSMYAYDVGFHYNRMGYASALAWVQLLILIALTVLAFRGAKRWVHYG